MNNEERNIERRADEEIPGGRKAPRGENARPGDGRHAGYAGRGGRHAKEKVLLLQRFRH